MSTRLTLLLAGTALVAASAPAAAHEGDHYGEHVVVEEHAGTYDGEWQGQWQDDETWRGMWEGTYTTSSGEQLEARYVGTFIGEGRFVTDGGQVLLLDDRYGWRESEDRYHVRHERHRGALGASPDGRLGYTLAEREAWLADCRFVMAGRDNYYRYDDDGNGAVVGGLLGAVVGGVAGNRIADGDRLAGTLIGAGVGGLAGAAIGSAVDGDGRREWTANEVWAARYCETYLRRYEMGGGYAGYYGQGYAQPVMMVQTVSAIPHGHPGHRCRPECATTVHEEWVEVEAPAPRARRVVRPRRPAPEPQGKLTPID